MTEKEKNFNELILPALKVTTFKEFKDHLEDVIDNHDFDLHFQLNPTRVHPRLEREIGDIWKKSAPDYWGRTTNIKVFLKINKETSGCGCFYQRFILLIENDDSTCIYQRKKEVEIASNFQGDRCNAPRRKGDFYWSF